MTSALYPVWLRRQILATDRRGNFTVSLCDPAAFAEWKQKREPVIVTAAPRAATKTRVKREPKRPDADGVYRL